ncbi:MAG: hypothetical protein J7K54_04355 [Candidatus Aenigmarchaeota archaeon]|nr:hypothetical protein [Candidatus Aenigmarchaeota archaeon]
MSSYMFKHFHLLFLLLLLSVFLIYNAHQAFAFTDSDGDGLSDSDESIWGTNPDNPDTDADGLSDGDEVWIYHIIPTDDDTDKDGLKDGTEVLQFGTDPLKPSTDGDMYDDRQEIFGTSKDGIPMPGYVLPPADNVFVAAYPTIDVDVFEQVKVTDIALIYTETREINMSEVSYSVANTNGVSMTVGNSMAYKKSNWIDMGNEEEDINQRNEYREDVRSTEEKSWKGYNFGTKVIGEVGDETWVKGGGEVGVVGPVPTAKVSVEAGHKIYANVKGIVESGTEGKDYVGESITKKVTGETTKKHVAKTYKRAGSGLESSFSTTVSRSTYHETSVTNTNSIAQGYEWATATTVDPSRAATLRFTLYIKNTGTDIAKEIRDLRFNIFIGQSQIPITYPALTENGISLNNLEPGERVQLSGEFTVTLDELKAIDTGEPIRILIAYYSYGNEELFYESAWGEDVLVEIDDDATGTEKNTKKFMTYTKFDENYLDVLKRLNRTVRIRNHGTRIEVPLETRNNTIVSLLGKPVTEWSWWTAYLQNPTNETSFSEEPSKGKTRLLLVYNKDTDHDYYTDRAETERGTDINDPKSYPSPKLVAGYFVEKESGNTTVQLKLSNYGNFDAYGIEARMYSPDNTTHIYDGFIGGGGRVEAGRTLIIPNETFIYTNNTANFTRPVIILYYNDPQGHHSFIVENELSALNETLSEYAEDKLDEPHFGLQANDEYTYSEDNFLIVNYDNPVERITNANIFVAFQNMSGYVIHYENRTVNLETGNNSFVFWWKPYNDLSEDKLGEDYKVMVALTDYQNVMLYVDLHPFRITPYTTYPRLVNTLSDGSLEKEIIFNGSGEERTVWVNLPKNAHITNGSIEVESYLSDISDIYVDFNNDGVYDIKKPIESVTHTFSRLEDVNGNKSVILTYNETGIKNITFEFPVDVRFKMLSAVMEIIGHKINHYSVTRDFYGENSSSDTRFFGYSSEPESCNRNRYYLADFEYSDNQYQTLWLNDGIGTLYGFNPSTIDRDDRCREHHIYFYTPESSENIDTLTFIWVGYVTSNNPGCGEVREVRIWNGSEWNFLKSYCGNGWKTMIIPTVMKPEYLRDNTIRFRLAYRDTPEKGEYSYILTDYVNLTLNMKSYTENISIDIGNDGEIDHFINGKLNESNSPVYIYLNVDKMQDFSSPLTVGLVTESLGKIEVRAVNITYSTLESNNSIDFNKSALTEYLNNCVSDENDMCQVPITFFLDYPGVLKLTNLRIFYELPDNPPQIISKAPKTENMTIFEGNTVNFTIEAEDPEGHDITTRWYVDGVYTGIEGENYSYFAGFTTAGTHTITASISDGMMSTNQTWSLNVTDFYEASITINPEHISSGVGEDIPFDIDINTTAEIYGVQFEMKFNQNITQVVAMNEGGFLSNDGASTFPIINIDNETGHIVFVNTRRTVDYGVSGTGNIAVITFRTQKEGIDTLLMENVQISEVDDGQVSAVPLDSPPSATLTVFRLAGDVNGDCTVNIIDLASVGWAYGSVQGDSNWIATADVYTDGVIDILDLATVGLHYNTHC